MESTPRIVQPTFARLNDRNIELLKLIDRLTTWPGYPVWVNADAPKELLGPYAAGCRLQFDHHKTSIHGVKAWVSYTWSFGVPGIFVSMARRSSVPTFRRSRRGAEADVSNGTDGLLRRGLIERLPDRYSPDLNDELWATDDLSIRIRIGSGPVRREIMGTRSKGTQICELHRPNFPYWNVRFDRAGTLHPHLPSGDPTGPLKRIQDCVFFRLRVSPAGYRLLDERDVKPAAQVVLSPRIRLDETETAILRVLHDAEPSSVLLQDIAARADRSPRTISDRIRGLKRRGLISRPSGTARRGFVLTMTASELAQQIAAPLPTR